MLGAVSELARARFDGATLAGASFRRALCEDPGLAAALAGFGAAVAAAPVGVPAEAAKRRVQLGGVSGSELAPG